MLRTLLTVTLIAGATPTPSAPKRVAVAIRGSIEASLVRVDARAGPAIAAQVARLLRWRGDIIKDVHPRDELRLLYTPEAMPQLLAIAYTGSAIHLRAYRTSAGDGVPRYYDTGGALIEPTLAASPLASYIQITEIVQSGSGKRRHMGIDLKAPQGTPVRLPFAATVSRVNWATHGNGSCVEVIYTDGAAAGRLGRFLHLSAVATEMVPGSKHAAGTLVGAVGSTGHSLAPHLHYEVRERDGRTLDPLEIHGTTQSHVDPLRRDEFAREVARYDRMLAGEVATN